MTGERKHVQCRFCSWRRALWRSTAAGRHRNAFGALRDHIQEKHPAEFQKMLAEVHGPEMPEVYLDMAPDHPAVGESDGLDAMARRWLW